MELSDKDTRRPAVPRAGVVEDTEAAHGSAGQRSTVRRHNPKPVSRTTATEPTRVFRLGIITPSGRRDSAESANLAEPGTQSRRQLAPPPIGVRHARGTPG
ncbi:hypothetical protein GCM10027589_28340 [Actinocorallia lasiicapitis]